MDREKSEKRYILILVVATVLLLAALTLGWYFGLVKKVDTEREAAQKDYEARKTVADQLETAQIDQRKAEDRFVEVQGQLEFFRHLYRSLEIGAIGTDPASETDVQRLERARTWRAWVREYFSEYSSALSATLLTKAAQSGVILDNSVQNIKVANPPQVPEDVVAPPNGFLKPTQSSAASQGAAGLGAPGGFTSPASPVGGVPGGLGMGGGGNTTSAPGAVALKATGTLPQLIDFFQRLNSSPILMVVQNIKLDSALGTARSSNGLGTTGLSTVPATTFPGAAASAQPSVPSGAPKVTAAFNLVPYLLARGAGAPITAGSATAAAAPAAGGPPGMMPGMTSPGGSANGATP